MHRDEVGRIKISHVVNLGWRSSRDSTARIAFWLNVTPFETHVGPTGNPVVMVGYNTGVLEIILPNAVFGISFP